MLYAILIDDEAAARSDLRAKLALHPGVTVIGEAATLSAARALLTSVDYNLVFLDVQLVGGDSFRLLPDMRPQTSVIFATAFERYAARAFECNAVDYLLKPIEPVRLAEAIRRAAFAQEVTGSDHEPGVPMRPAGVPDSFSEVALTPDERVYLRLCLEAWEDSLPPAHLLRSTLGRSVRLPREVFYEPGAEPTRLFVAEAPLSWSRRLWRAFCARLGV